MFVRMVVFKRVAGYLLRSESPKPLTKKWGQVKHFDGDKILIFCYNTVLLTCS